MTTASTTAQASADAATYNTIIRETSLIALATCADGEPNVRIVNFCPDATRPHVLLFATSRTDAKVGEFRRNPHVALTTIPMGSIPHARAKDAMVHPSKYHLNDVKDAFIARIPHFAESVETVGHELDIFEIHLKTVSLVVDYSPPHVLTFA